jgi:uracil-DNA glycosylase
MMPKPSACIGCPFANKGAYFTPDNMVEGSKVLFIAQNPGESEEAGRKLVKRHWQGSQYIDECESVTPQPLIGVTGQMFNNRFLPLAQLHRKDVSVANVIRCRPGTALHLKPNGLPPITTTMHLESSKADIVKAMKHCNDAYLHIPDSVQLIVTMGRYAQFALTGIQQEDSEYTKRAGVIESWRGYGLDYSAEHHKLYRTVDTTHYHPLQHSERQLFVMMHIAALFEGENKKYFHATLQDFHKVGRLLRGEWPVQLPTWSSDPPSQWPSYAAFDTEYVPDGNKLIRWSLCDENYRLYCVESDTDSSYNSYIPINPGSTVLIQNALADIAHLATLVDVTDVTLEDLMLAHSVLWTGEPHSLNYIASVAGAFNRYKHLAHEEGQQQLYSALDAYEPMHIWQYSMLPEFKRDAAAVTQLKTMSPQALTSWQLYRKLRMPLVNIIDKAQRSGVAIDGYRLADVQSIVQEKVSQLLQAARDITNDPTFNLGGSKQMKQVIYGNNED